MEGGKYTQRIGSRRQVMSGTAHHTSGGLTKKDLMLNKRGRIVSRRKSAAAKKSKIINRVADRMFTRETARAALSMRKSMRGGSNLSGGEIEAGGQCGMRRY